MSAPEYLSIKDFAAAANVSTQRIYQRLAKDLQSYCKVENGKKYLSSEGLKLFGKEDLQVDLPNNMQELTNTLQETIEALREQLTEKDKQIAELTAALKTSQQQLTVAQEQQTALTTALTQQQALHAGDIQRQLVEQSEPPESEPEIIPEPEQKKQSLFSKLFRKRSE